MYRYYVYAVPVFLPFSLPADSINPQRRPAQTERLWKEIVRSGKLASLFSSFFRQRLPYAVYDLTSFARCKLFYKRLLLSSCLSDP